MSWQMSVQISTMQFSAGIRRGQCEKVSEVAVCDRDHVKLKWKYTFAYWPWGTRELGGVYSRHSWCLIHRLSGRSDFLGYLSRQLAQTLIFPEILHRVNGEGGAYTDAEGLQRFVVVQLVTASVHNHTAVHKIWITLDTAVTINYNWWQATGSTFGVHHEKRNVEEEDSSIRTCKEHHIMHTHSPHAIHSTYVHLLAGSRCSHFQVPVQKWKKLDGWVLKQGYIQVCNTATSLVAGCLISVHSWSFLLQRQFPWVQ